MSEQEFAVTGLTCGHCVAAVTEELSAVPSITEVTIELVSGGVSRVRVQAAEQVSDAVLDEALAEAGDYHRVDAGTASAPQEEPR